MPTPSAQFDSSFSLAMLETALTMPEIKSALAEIAANLRMSILSELKRQEDANLAPNLSSLAMQHSTGDKYVGALLPGYSADYLEHDPNGRRLLLATIDECLQNAANISTHHEFLALMKTIDGMAFVYDMFETAKGNPIHLKCKDYIAPTNDEVKIRSRRTENVLAVSYGIGTESGTDLVPARETTSGCFSGKARFFILPTENRIKTWFEKLADQNHLNKPSLPLLASPSNAAAKTFMMANGIGLFLKQENGLFDFDKAQIFANCVMAYLVYCGHHSFLEVAEIWNRQLDYVGIEKPEQLPTGIIPTVATVEPYFNYQDAVERKLPYAVIGEYSRFLHPLYTDKVMLLTHKQLTEGLDLRFDCGSVAVAAL